MTHPIDTLEYWVDDFTPSTDEFEALYGFVVEAGVPMELEALAAELIRRRAERLTAAQRQARKGAGALYSPNDRYTKGQKVTFPALDGLTGTVKSIRPGNNTAYGAYDVLAVDLDGHMREFAAGLETPHVLTAPSVDIEPTEIAQRFASLVAPGLATVLSSDAEWVHYGDRWILRELLPDINVGHLNLAEAVAMLADGPVTTGELLPELDIAGKAPAHTKEFALIIGLSSDRRFRNVGALEAPLWALTSQMDT